MGLFSSSKSDGAFTPRPANTIENKHWRSLQDRAAKSNPTRDESDMKRGRDSYRNRGNN